MGVERLHQHVGGGLQQLAGGDAIGVEHDLVADRELAALHDACGFKRLGVGPHGVMVEAADNEGNVGDDAVENLPRDRLAKALMGDAGGEQHGDHPGAVLRY